MSPRALGSPLVLLGLVLAAATPARADRLAAGANHSVVTAAGPPSGGVAWSFGKGSSGANGNGGTGNKFLPTQVSGLTNVVAVAAGVNHTLYLTADGELYTAGLNSDGELGLGDTTQRNAPVLVPGLPTIAGITAGLNFSAVWTTGGALYTFGSTNYGKACVAAGDDQVSPVLVSGVSGVVGAAAGDSHLLILTETALLACGRNQAGQLGNNTLVDSATPVTVQELGGVPSSVAAGDNHSLAVVGGVPYSWGRGADGALGSGGTANRKKAATIGSLMGVSRLAGGATHTLILFADGTVMATGLNAYSELGDGTTTQRLSPVAVPGLSGIVEIEAGTNHSLALDGSGVLYGWGRSQLGQTGTGQSATVGTPIPISDAGLAWRSPLPIITPASGMAEVSVSVSMTCTPCTGTTIRYTLDGTEPTTSSTAYGIAFDVTARTTVKAKGFKTGYQPSATATAVYGIWLGTLSEPSFDPTPGTVIDPTSVSMAQAQAGEIRVTQSTSGAPGDPDASSPLYTAPIALGAPDTSLKAKAYKFDWHESPVAAGAYSLKVATPVLGQPAGSYPARTPVSVSCATPGATIRYTIDGTEPSATSPAIPDQAFFALLGDITLKVKAFKATAHDSDTVTVAYTVTGAGGGPWAGSSPTSYVRRPDGSAWGWGLNDSSQLADGTTTTRTTPVSIAGTDHLVAISAGHKHALGLRADGTLLAWGRNPHGQIGNGTTVEQSTPTPVLTGVVAMAAGFSHSLAVKADGTLWGFGRNDSGALGDGQGLNLTLPTLIPGITGAKAVAAGTNFSLVLLQDGTVRAMGSNGSGQLGDATTTDRLSPVTVSGLTGVSRISAGELHSMALLDTGAVWAWGGNGSGRLGVGLSGAQLAYAATPQATTATSGVVSISAGLTHSILAKSDGTVWAAGIDNFGQVSGTPGGPVRTSFTQVSGPSAITEVETSRDSNVAVTADAQVHLWGKNLNAELGNGTQTAITGTFQIADAGVVFKVLPVSISPNGGSFTVAQAVTLSTLTPSATIKYTTDGTDPVSSGTAQTYTAPIDVATQTTLKAAAVRTNWAASPVSTASFTFNYGTLSLPTASPAGGSYTAVQSVTLSGSPAGTSVRYTTNGSDPDGSSTLATGPVTVDTPLTLKSRAYHPDYIESGVRSDPYTFTVPTPGFAPGTGTYNTPQSVTVTGGAGTIHYTLNGVDPTESDPTVASGGTVAIDQTATLKAKGFNPGWTSSGVASATYTMVVATPSLNASGTGPIAVTVSTVTPGATLRYTVDGTPVSTASPVVTGGQVVLSQSAVLKVQGFRTGWTDSAVAIATYWVDMGTVAMPVATPGAGTYAASQWVTLTCTTPGAAIRYTRDGIEPTFQSPLYAGPVRVAPGQVLKAQAYLLDWTPSAVLAASHVPASGVVAAPVLSPQGGEFASQVTVAVTSSTAGATLHYRLDGLEPTASDPVVAGGQVVVDETSVLRVRAVSGGVWSESTQERYLLTGALTAGSLSMLGLKSDGTVWGWGVNEYGQLATGNTNPGETPMQAVGLDDAVAVASGSSHSLFLRADGRVWAAGSNALGQLGRTGASSSTPVQVVGLPGPTNDPVVQVVAVGQASAALTRSGLVYRWGDSLGEGYGYLEATLVPGLGGVTAIAGSPAGRAIYALQTDGAAQGRVWAWGDDYLGALGDGPGYTGQTEAPILVAGLSDATRIFAGDLFGFGLRSNGTLMGWGREYAGRLGNGVTDPNNTYVNTPSPVTIPFPDVADMEAQGHVVALRDGTISTWGENGNWQLGIGDYSSRTEANPLAWIGRAVDVAAGGLTSAALLEDGTVVTWGSPAYGTYLLGDPSRTGPAPLPIPGFNLAPRGVDDPRLLDSDADGLTNWEEAEAGTEAGASDTNGDGLSDLAALRAGLSATDPDMDDDGVLNAAERAQGTDPFRADTDGDTYSDLVDLFPLDASRHALPPPGQGDTTPPVITLQHPSSAVPVP